jgi:hypothetical protein
MRRPLRGWSGSDGGDPLQWTVRRAGNDANFVNAAIGEDSVAIISDAQGGRGEARGTTGPIRDISNASAVCSRSFWMIRFENAPSPKVYSNHAASIFLKRPFANAMGGAACIRKKAPETEL